LCIRSASIVVQAAAEGDLRIYSSTAEGKLKATSSEPTILAK